MTVTGEDVLAATGGGGAVVADAGATGVGAGTAAAGEVDDEAGNEVGLLTLGAAVAAAGDEEDDDEPVALCFFSLFDQNERMLFMPPTKRT